MENNPTPPSRSFFAFIQRLMIRGISRRRDKTLIYSLLAAFCLLTYANSLNNAFISDDIPGILENPQISEPFSFWHLPSGLVNSLIYRIFGPRSPFSYHLVNLTLHSINTILVFLLLRLFFKKAPSFLAASLFAVHPVHTEAVTWISGKPYLFLAFFILASYLSYHRATNQASRRLNPFWYCLSLTLFSYYIIGNYSFFFLFPLFLAVSDTAFNRWQRNWRWWLPFIAIAVIRLYLAQHAISERISVLRDELGTPIVKNPLLYFSYSFYSHLWLLIWPERLSLCHEPFIFPPILRTYGLLFLFPVLALLFITFKKAKELFFALSVFILFLAPTYSSVPAVSSLIAERYIYFPSLALSIAFAFLYERFPRKCPRLKTPLLVILSLIIFAYACRSIIRNEDWKDPGRFWHKTLKAFPLSWNAHNNLALMHLERGEVKKAIAGFEKSVAINNQYANAYNNLGVAYNKIGYKEKAVSCLEKAIEINHRFSDAYNNLSTLYNELGLRDKAVAFSKKAIEINPKSADAYNNLGLAYKESGDKEGAIASFKRAIEVNPKYTKAYNNLGLAYAELGNKQAALTYYRKAIESEPRSAIAQYNLGNIYNDLGSKEEAVIFYERAIKIDPGFQEAYNNLGNAYVTMGMNKEAIEAYQKTLEINPNHTGAHFNLSIVYFKEKEYGLAIEHCDEAVKLGYNNVPLEFLKLLKPYRK